MKIPYNYASPCAKPFTGDNGGATADGVTEDSIKIVVYQADPSKDALAAATVRGSGADVSPATARTTYNGYFDLFEKYYNFYGRKLDVVFFPGTGAPDDEVTARADADAIADMHPFAVMSGPNRTPVWAQELAARHVMCVGNCSLAVPQKTIEDASQYLYGVGPTPEQAGLMTAKFVTTQPRGQEGRLRRRRRQEQDARVRRRPLRHRRRPAEGRLRHAEGRVQPGQREDRGRPAVPARPRPWPGERPHDHRQAEGRRRHDRRLHRRPADAGEPHQGGDRAELLPRVGHRLERARRHRALRPHLRPAAVAARVRARAHRGAGEPGREPGVQHVQVVQRREAAEQHLRRDPRRPVRDDERHQHGRTEALARDLQGRASTTRRCSGARRSRRRPHAASTACGPASTSGAATTPA